MPLLNVRIVFMVNNKTIQTEIVYISPSCQTMIQIQLPVGSNIKTAIMHSGLLKQCPEIDLEKNKVGIFNQIKPLDTILQPYDRIEIYRALLIDPKAARRGRANKQATIKTKNGV